MNQIEEQAMDQLVENVQREFGFYKDVQKIKLSLIKRLDKKGYVILKESFHLDDEGLINYLAMVSKINEEPKRIMIRKEIVEFIPTLKRSIKKIR